jgi:hypothetical protein
MAAKKKSGAVARLVESIEIHNADGSTTMVPVTAEDNSKANKILASQMRDLITKSIVKFGGLAIMTPKELKELTEAARNIAEFSGEVYKSGETIETGSIKRVEPIVSEVLDFSELKKNIVKPAPSEKPDGN